jgi:hypothetical protein
MTAPTIGVAGFGRCGSTMAMAMLRAGGIPAVDGSDPDSGELLDGIEALAGVELAGRAVKILDLAGRVPLPRADWRFIWLDRDPVQQARSVAKFVEWSTDGAIDLYAEDQDLKNLIRSYDLDRPRVLGELKRYGPVLVLQYERVLAQPKRASRALARFVAGLDGLTVAHPTVLRFDVRAAAGVVHARDGRCRPDCAVEQAIEDHPKEGTPT